MSCSATCALFWSFVYIYTCQCAAMWAHSSIPHPKTCLIMPVWRHMHAHTLTLSCIQIYKHRFAWKWLNMWSPNMSFLICHIKWKPNSWCCLLTSKEWCLYKCVCVRICVWAQGRHEKAKSVHLRRLPMPVMPLHSRCLVRTRTLIYWCLCSLLLMCLYLSSHSTDWGWGVDLNVIPCVRQCLYFHSTCVWHCFSAFVLKGVLSLFDRVALENRDPALGRQFFPQSHNGAGLEV